MSTPPWRDAYPFSDHMLALPGARMHYVDEGAGPPLLFLHGNPTWSFHFRHLLAHFQAAWRVVAPDHIGCGLSEKPQTYAYTLAQHIENAQALVERLDLRDIVLVAHDWGGAIGMGLALRVPQRVRGFVLFNTAAFPSRRLPPSIRLCRVPGFGAMAIRGANGFLRAALARCPAKPLDPQTRAGYLAPHGCWADRVAHLRFVQDIPMSPSHPSWSTLQRIEQGLASLRERPMQIFWGGRDFVFDDTFLAEWRRRFPDAAVERYPGAGHFVVEDERAAIIAGMERFLTRLPGIRP